MTEKIAYSVTEVCEATALGKTTVEALLRTGELQSVKVGARRLITRQHLDDFFASRGARIASEDSEPTD